MRTVRLPAREAREPGIRGIRVTAVLVDAACRRQMQPDPFVESHLWQSRADGRWGIAQELEAVVEIRWRLPEKATVYLDRLLALVLVPDGPHPRTGSAIRCEKMRGREWAAIVHQADQKCGRFAVPPAFGKDVAFRCRRRLQRKRQLDPGDIFVPDTERERVEHRRLARTHRDITSLVVDRAEVYGEPGILHLPLELLRCPFGRLELHEEEQLGIPLVEKLEILEIRRDRVQEVRAKAVRVAVAFGHGMFSASGCRTMLCLDRNSKSALPLCLRLGPYMLHQRGQRDGACRGGLGVERPGAVEVLGGVERVEVRGRSAVD